MLHVATDDGLDFNNAAAVCNVEPDKITYLKLHHKLWKKKIHRNNIDVGAYIKGHELPCLDIIF